MSDQIDEDHPLVLEISSLKAAVTRLQGEAHSASLKLQRFSLDSSNAQDRAAHLERENELLLSELAILRANPHPDSSSGSHPAVFQSQELTLSLRRLSEKLSLTEQALLDRTVELTHVKSEVIKSRFAVEGAYALAARTKGREEEGKVRERELERRVRELQEELKMEDLVVKEYADLVRSLEGRNNTELALSNGSTVTLVDGVSESKANLQKLFFEFSQESERLLAETERLNGELGLSKTLLEAERKGAEEDRIYCAKAQKELQMAKLEDKSAASMVSRYMRFSQASTNSLQNSFDVLKARHSATIDTFTSQLASLSAQLKSSRTTSERLRSIVDELGQDIIRESYGRRREIALRLKLVVREEALQESMNRWIRRAQEIFDQDYEQIPRPSLEKLLSDARAVYAVLDTPAAAKAPPPPLSNSQYSPYSAPAGSLARLVAMEASVLSLSEELQAQIIRRQELELSVALSESQPSPSAWDGTSSAVGQATEDISKEPDIKSTFPFSETTLDPTTVHANESLETPPSSDPSLLGSFPLPEENKTTLRAIVVDATLTESHSSTEHLLNGENPDRPSGSVLFPNSAGETFVDGESETAEQHPLIEELMRVSHRYDEIQRAFRDCHLALQELKKVISLDAMSMHTINGVSTEIFQAAVDRLDNYNEDARVELEIRAADEALLAQGYQTMLSLSGTSVVSPLTSAFLLRSFSQDSQEVEPTAEVLELQIREFTSGEDLNVQRALQSLTRKLGDVQNDIAILKRATHDPDAFGATSTANDLKSSSHASNSGWTSWIRGSPSQTMASPSPPPTFGHVMTSPRLKHSLSFQRDLGVRPGSIGEFNPQHAHPFSSLDLRVSMPMFSSPSSSKSVFSPPGIDWHGPRTRTVSTMNMLGLGGQSGSPRPQRIERTPSSPSPGEGHENSGDDVE
ncbi:hypothetical protein D9757_002893 [Collybiopsis confluens]|uniref:Uncharacterized protein n=1 Tax=Collybiopsis confluens TaxID=2823264 RepID=A0A8H5HVX7_9AGAR|nr:hypothetical protein D9757_002893 [Collybiopsis confluens]